MIYATVALAIVMLLSAGYGKIKQGNALPIVGSAVTLCIFAGLRDISFGSDLLGYKNRYLHYVSFVSYADIIAQYENGTMKDGLFYVIMKFFADNGWPYQLFIASVTGFYIIAVTLLIAKCPHVPTISFMMFIALSWLQFSFTGLRQAVAMGICTIALVLLLQNKKSWVAVLLIVISGFAHSSAWIFLIAPIVFRFNLNIRRKRFVELTLISMTLSLLCGSIFRKIVSAIAWNNTLAEYANSSISLNWTGFIIQFLFAAVSFVFYEDTVKENPNFPALYSLIAIGLAFQAFSSVIAEMFRISMYFSLSSVCVYPAAVVSINRDKYRSLAIYASVLLLLFYFFVAEKYVTYIPILR